MWRKSCSKGKNFQIKKIMDFLGIGIVLGNYWRKTNLIISTRILNSVMIFNLWFLFTHPHIKKEL